MTHLLLELWPYIVTVFGVIGVYLFGKQKGKHQQETKDIINNYEKREIARQKVKEIDKKTESYNDDELFAIADKWVRNSTKTK